MKIDIFVKIRNRHFQQIFTPTYLYNHKIQEKRRETRMFITEIMKINERTEWFIFALFYDVFICYGERKLSATEPIYSSMHVKNWVRKNLIEFHNLQIRPFAKSLCQKNLSFDGVDKYDYLFFCYFC